MKAKTIGVGVPTFNRAEKLRETLICLKKQSYGDFTALVTDNLSTDHTREVFENTVGKDPRFQYLRLSQHVSMKENFYVSLDRLNTEYFLWRADDDLSDLRYLEVLSECLDANEEADLAVSALKFLDETENLERHLKLPSYPSANSKKLASFFLLNTRAPTWIYGMWRRKELLSNWDKAKNYPYVWAKDHLLLLPSLLRGRIGFTNDTWFYQRVFDEHRPYAEQMRNSSERLRARKIYSQIAGEMLREVGSISGSLIVRVALHRHIERSVGRLWRLRRRVLQSKIKRAFQ